MVTNYSLTLYAALTYEYVVMVYVYFMQNIVRLGSRSECPIMQKLGLFDARQKILHKFPSRYAIAKSDMQKSFIALRLAFFQRKSLDINGSESFKNCNLARLRYIMCHFTSEYKYSIIDKIVNR